MSLRLVLERCIVRDATGVALKRDGNLRIHCRPHRTRMRRTCMLPIACTISANVCSNEHHVFEEDSHARRSPSSNGLFTTMQSGPSTSVSQSSQSDRLLDDPDWAQLVTEHMGDARNVHHRWPHFILKLSTWPHEYLVCT